MIGKDVCKRYTFSYLDEVKFSTILLKIAVLVILETDTMGTLIYVFRNWSCPVFLYCNNTEWNWERISWQFCSFLIHGRILEMKQNTYYTLFHLTFFS